MFSKVTLGARVLLGLIFFVFGLNGFLNFIPLPPLNEQAGAFLGALAATGYMFPLIKGTEVIAGALLLSGFFVPFSLLLLSPIVVNIVAFHALLAKDGNPLVVVLPVLMVLVALRHKEQFRSVLQK